jgi:hypothetical protein
LKKQIYLKLLVPFFLKTSHHNAQAEWNQIKTNENLVQKKTTQYLDMWNKAGRPELPPSKKTPTKKDGTSRSNSRKRTFSSDDDKQNDDPNYDSNSVEPVTPTSAKRKALIEIDDLEADLLAKEKSWIVRSAEKAAAKKKADAATEAEKVKAPVQESVLNELKQISERIENLIQVKSMGLLTAENQKKLKKLIEQKQQRTTDLKRLQARQRASTRYRERQKRHVEQICVTNPAAAAELSKVFRPTTTTTRMQIEADCPDLLQIIGEIARVGGATDNNTGNSCLSLDSLKDAIKQRGYEIRKSSLYYR